MAMVIPFLLGLRKTSGKRDGNALFYSSMASPYVPLVKKEAKRLTACTQQTASLFILCETRPSRPDPTAKCRASLT